MSSERIACSKCQGWMFHLAKKCPHCGAENLKAPQTLELSGDEARALLATTVTHRGPASFADIAHEVVFPRDGVPEVVLSLLAAPLTLSTVLTMGYFLLREKRSKRQDALVGAQLLAVPACAAFVAVTLFQLQVPPWAWVVFGTSLAAWAGRAVLRRR